MIEDGQIKCLTCATSSCCFFIIWPLERFQRCMVLFDLLLYQFVSIGSWMSEPIEFNYLIISTVSTVESCGFQWTTGHLVMIWSVMDLMVLGWWYSFGRSLRRSPAWEAVKLTMMAWRALRRRGGCRFDWAMYLPILRALNDSEALCLCVCVCVRACVRTCMCVKLCIVEAVQKVIILKEIEAWERNAKNWTFDKKEDTNWY
jgi:hypothetical protein